MTPGFFFGQDDPLSPQALKRKRDIVDLIARRSLSTPQANTAVGGLGNAGSSIVQALMARYGDRKLAPLEDAERQRVGGTLGSILGARPPGSLLGSGWGGQPAAAPSPLKPVPSAPRGSGIFGFLKR